MTKTAKPEAPAVKQQTPEVEMAEHFYAVANNLEQNAHITLQMAERLNSIADNFCEQSIRKYPKPSKDKP